MPHDLPARPSPCRALRSSLLGVGGEYGVRRRLLAPLACDSCRVGLFRSEVDSIRTGDPTGGLWGSAGLIIVGLLGVIFFTCATGSACPAGVNGT